MKTWREAVINGIRRLTINKNSYLFSRQEIINTQLTQIIEEVQSIGETPSQTLSRVLQELRDENLIEFVDNTGNYVFLVDNINIGQEDLPETAIDVAIKTGRLQFNDISTDERLIEARQRVGQDRLRFWTLINYQSQCALCDISDQRLLVASHIARWADYPKGRGDLSNIICLCRWHDPLIEYGLISFSNGHEILKKPTKSQMLTKILDETNIYQEPLAMPLSSEYLEIHRKKHHF
ncbi:MAG: HNH endonuclease signature motif containing protein [Brevefilum sp.]|nr:HNH endonuclease signature motif containing protein [Brevefilum sp.]